MAIAVERFGLHDAPSLVRRLSPRWYHPFNMRALLRGFSIAGLLALTLGATVTSGPPGGTLAGFEGNGGWLNSAPLSPADLHGKVVLVDFWEYTCVNCLRTLPYLHTWYDRYRNDGFVIVGVHTNEFGFSGDRGNIEAADAHLGVNWPVVIDPNHEIWSRYHNDGWPHEYLFDQNGQLVDSVRGEGEYPNTERKIQGLLRALNPQLALPPVMALLPQDSYDKPGAVCYLQTPEVLVDHSHIANASAFGDPSEDTPYVDKAPVHKDGLVYLQGLWHLTQQFAVEESLRGYAAIRYHAIQVVSVLAPSDQKNVRIDVTQDGAPVAKADAGADLHYDAAGKSYLTVDAARAYDIIMNAKFDQHELRLVPQGYGVGVYSFAFESCEIPK
jgi:thiol-disulfide isomerase/thioredoxin